MEICGAPQGPEEILGKLFVCVCVCVCVCVLCELSVHDCKQTETPKLFLHKTQTCLEQDLNIKSTCFKDQTLSILSTQFICMFSTNLTINNYYFPKQHRPIFICNGDRHLFCGTQGVRFLSSFLHEIRASSAELLRNMPYVNKFQFVRKFFFIETIFALSFLVTLYLP